MKSIFVSYRRADSSDVTGRIFDRLKARFGEGELFKDVESIPYGSDFRLTITEAISHCKVLLAIIGPDWLELAGENGTRRLDEPNDYVRVEIVSALEANIPVIPVLVENASPPKRDQLPKPLEELAFRNAALVRADPDFANDMNRLCKQLEKYIRPKKAHASKISFVGTFLTVALACLFFWHKDRLPERPLVRQWQLESEVASGIAKYLHDMGSVKLSKSLESDRARFLFTLQEDAGNEIIGQSYVLQFDSAPRHITVEFSIAGEFDVAKFSAMEGTLVNVEGTINKIEKGSDVRASVRIVDAKFVPIPSD